MKLIAGIKVHPNALAVSKDKPLNISDVKDWLEYNDNMRKKYSTLARKKEKGALARSLIHEGYIREIRFDPLHPCQSSLFLTTVITIVLYYSHDCYHDCSMLFS